MAGVDLAPKIGNWTGEFVDLAVEAEYRSVTSPDRARRIRLLTAAVVIVEIGLIATDRYFIGSEHRAFLWLLYLRAIMLGLAGFLFTRPQQFFGTLLQDGILAVGFLAHLGTLWILAHQVPRLAPEMFQLQFNLAVFALSALLFFAWRANMVLTLVVSCLLPVVYGLTIPAATGRGLAFHAPDLLVISLFIVTAYISARAIEAGDRQRHLAVLEHEMREKQARDLANARRELIELVSHNYRQPLHALAFYTEAAARLGAATDPASRSQFAEVASKQKEVVKALRSDLQRLLDYIRLDSGFLQPELAPFPLDGITKHVERVHGARAFESGIEIRYRTSGTRSIGDYTLICTILDSLVNNAVAYCDPAKLTRSILVSARQRSSVLMVDVVDNGLGIAESDLSRIGRAYFRGASAETRSAAGTGLGLAIVFRLAEALGGTCTICSKFGTGTRVRVVLPSGPISENTLRSELAGGGLRRHSSRHADTFAAV